MNGKTAKRMRKLAKLMSNPQMPQVEYETRKTRKLTPNCARFIYKMCKKFYKINKRKGAPNG